MRASRASILAGLLASSTLAPAQPPPPAWRVLKDGLGTCQVTVPGDWTGPAAGLARDPSGGESAVVHGLSRGQAWSQAMSTARIVMKPVKIFEDSSTRLFYSYQASGAKQGWYAAIPGSPTICTAQVEFRDAGFEATAKAIVSSLGSTK